ncbi:nitronate monooxygenase [Paenibacillus glucanolyticus]|uniref:NAD(P)H-dependent flavin oxidoreductase n=1 Tax=Paenibacillus glucanolyticus TaxID=59843 RepID=UPI0030C8ECCE
MSEVKLLTAFQLKLPLIQAGMGGIAGPELAAAVSNHGGLGVLAVYKSLPEDMFKNIEKTRELTSGFFGINVIPEVSGEARLKQQIEAIVASDERRIAVVFYGVPPFAVVNLLKMENILVIIQIGTEAEAQTAVEMGADFLVLQGIQAGGHHLGSQRTEQLFEDVAARGFDAGLIVAGGIATGRDYAVYRQMGASGCLCGTLFVSALESSAHPRYKDMICQAMPEDTIITNLFEIGWPGRQHRVILNQTVKMGKIQPTHFIAKTVVDEKLYPVARFSAAAPTEHTQGEIENMALYCGESCRNIHMVNSVSNIMDQFAAELMESLGGKR